ncbi:putative indole-3-pyruvate monooxygenase YUCCA4 [Hordeum vulgare]|uniref:indole-3-pyruvate monooxygenase YUCCA1-like isoform X2 n=1 Tax=Hordeum vulgare subsp. vulgare TaxID=112509 RepID=UPI001D1A5599|nr:indole-3-pyruvate monooxygenase YUCCA1-like isoform X2 [Hordeum vulgare subsp. vulgare]KAE8806768.1 putative indole-3-pyruvate monooxygenase YUCCA4 [Hordeum vulgare]
MDKEQEEEGRATWVSGALIVGAGPSGLAAAACLAARGVPATVLERSDSLAFTWRHRMYDRLALHLPKHFCELPLLPFPAEYPTYPCKDQFVAYMEAYAAAAGVAPRFGASVEEAAFDASVGAWAVRLAGGEVLMTRWLVVATGENAEPHVPDFPGMRQFAGRVLHTCDYKCGEEFAGEKVLVVGCGNSGMEVHVLPKEMLGVSTFGIAMALLKWLPVQLVDRFILAAARLTLGNTSQLGLRRPKTGPIELKNLTGRTPVLDVGTLDHIKSGKIKVVGAVKEVTRRGARLADGKEEEQFDAIILATGYRSNVPSWLKDGGDVFTREGTPKTPFPDGWKGRNGLYTVGFSQRGLLGASSDALCVARDIHCQWRERDKPTSDVHQADSSV